MIEEASSTQSRGDGAHDNVTNLLNSDNAVCTRGCCRSLGGKQPSQRCHCVREPLAACLDQDYMRLVPHSPLLLLQLAPRRLSIFQRHCVAFTATCMSSHVILISYSPAVVIYLTHGSA